VPCLKCGGKVEDGALICNRCADASFQEPKFFLNPVLLGTSAFSRMRSKGSAAYILGPNTGSDVIHVPSADLVKAVREMNVQELSHEEAKPFFERCDILLGHLGVSIKSELPDMLLTEDAVEGISVIVQKVNAAEKMFPLEGMSDLYIRMGVVYWAASRGILLRTASREWREGKRNYLISRAKEFLSKVDQGDDLYSIASRTKGLMCLDAGEWAEAEEYLAIAVKSFPSDFKIGEGLARAHLMLGNQMEALSIVDEMLTITERAELWVLKGKILKDLDRPREAADCFSRAISIDSNYLPGHDSFVEILRDMGRLEDAAMAESQRALSRRPELEKKLTELMSEFERVADEERPPGAKQRIEKKETPKPMESTPRVDPIDTARKALAANDFDLAIQKVREILRYSPESRDATLVLIEALVSKGDVKEASALAHSFYEKSHGDPMAWYWRGVIAGKEGRWGAAVQYFSKAVTLDPKALNAWTAMGEELLAHNKSPGADESFTRALELDPENPRAWFGKGKTMYVMNRWGAAIQSLDKYTLLVPKDQEAWRFKADILFEKEKFKRAVEAYDKYLELAGDESHALGRKGIALNAIGMTGDAKKCLEEAVRLDPENKEAEKWLKALTGGES
jgi:tetratricopeptide (TPR) repeat protein